MLSISLSTVAPWQFEIEEFSPGLFIYLKGGMIASASHRFLCLRDLALPLAV
jgi:hypothetical protein